MSLGELKSMVVDGDERVFYVEVSKVRAEPWEKGIIIVVADGEYRVAPVGLLADEVLVALCVQAIWRRKHRYEEEYEGLCSATAEDGES